MSLCLSCGAVGLDFCSYSWVTFRGTVPISSGQTPRGGGGLGGGSRQYGSRCVVVLCVVPPPEFGVQAFFLVPGDDTRCDVLLASTGPFMAAHFSRALAFAVASGACLRPLVVPLMAANWVCVLPSFGPAVTCTFMAVPLICVRPFVGITQVAISSRTCLLTAVSQVHIWLRFAGAGWHGGVVSE